MMGASVGENTVASMTPSSTQAANLAAAAAVAAMGSPTATTQPILCKPQISQEMDSGIENMDMDEYPSSLGVSNELINIDGM